MNGRAVEARRMQRRGHEDRITPRARGLAAYTRHRRTWSSIERASWRSVEYRA
jgi:hypothetical protein